MDAAEVSVVGDEERATYPESHCSVESVGRPQAGLGTQAGGVFKHLVRGIKQSNTTVALLVPVVTAAVGSDIAGLGPDGAVSTETRTEQAQLGDWPSIQGG